MFHFIYAGCRVAWTVFQIYNIAKSCGGAGGGCPPLAGVQGVEMMSGKLKADKTNNYACSAGVIFDYKRNE